MMDVDIQIDEDFHSQIGKDNDLSINEVNNQELCNNDNVENDKNSLNTSKCVAVLAQKESEDNLEKPCITNCKSEVKNKGSLDYSENISGEDDNCINSNNAADSEDEDQFIIVPKKSKSNKKFSNVIDSNSESENETTHVSKNKEVSDRDEDKFKSNLDENSDELPEITKRKKQRRIAIIDSDSDEEVTNASKDNVQSKCERIGEISEVFVDKHEDLEDQEDIKLKYQKKVLSTLCDSESSDDVSDENDEAERNGGISDDELNVLKSNVIVPSKSRKQNVEKNDTEKSEKMTAKKALEQKKEILSESQRRVRESRVSLPYHKPKPRSLKEFLQNRPKLASALSNIPQGQSPSAAIKMSMEQIKIVSENLKKREKEIEQFYKSDSESENEENVDNGESVEICSDNTLGKIETLESEENIQGQNKNIVFEDDSCEDINTAKITEESGMEKTDNVIQKLIEPEDTSLVLINENICDEIKKSPNNLIEKKHLVESDNVQHEKMNEIVTDACVGKIKESENLEEKIYVDNWEQTTEIDEEMAREDRQVQEYTEIKEINTNISTQGTEPDQNTILDTTDPNKPEEPIKIKILSDVVIQSSESENKNIYNLDDELLELANEVENVKKRYSDNYEFNLDDIEDESEQDNNLRKEEMAIEENPLKKQIKLELLEKLAASKPRLSGGPNQIIDLENGVVLPDEVSKLRERFLQHNLKMGKQRHKEMSIMSVFDGKIQKETLEFNVDEEDEESTAPIEKPGVRFQKLRLELEHQIAQRRSQLWKEKQKQPHKTNEEEEDKNDGEKSDCGIDNLLDADEEEEMTESEEEEDDEELEENDCDMSEPKKKQSAFIEGEAEESDIDEKEYDAVSLNDEFDDEGEDVHEEEEEGEEADAEDNEEQTDDINNEIPRKKVLKRIIKPFDNDDSDDDDLEDHKYSTIEFKFKKKEIKSNSDEEFLPPNQPINYKTRAPVLTPTRTEIDFLTPVTYLTGLRNLNTSGSRITAPVDVSPEKNDLYSSHKRLFAEEINSKSQDNSSTTQEILNNSSEIEQTAIGSSNHSVNIHSSEQGVISTQDVLAICSGEFQSSSKSISSPEISTQQLKEIFTDTNSDIQKSSDFNTQDLADICSGQFTEITSAEKQKEKETVLDEKDEDIISQLIDEEELERFKKKFESPLAACTQKTVNYEQADEVQGSGGVIDSEGEDDELQLKKKKRKRLAFSDDEESSACDSAPEETIDLQDDEDLASNIDYDSEENEIDPDRRRLDLEERKKEIVKASEFFEKEAELSESEWGSEDEDEKNLDDMEFEKGDEDKFDEDQLRGEIEKMQMRQMLDEDNREVKLLQELLLEDGELHGSGRQRQFKWRNIDALGNDIEGKLDDDGDVYLDEDESEEQWRRMRHEREMFIMKKQSQEDEDTLMIESQKLSFTHKSLKIKSQKSVLSHTVSGETTNSPKIKQPFSLLNKRGSFLSRSEQILQKFAETSQISIGSKTSNRIVFQVVDQEQKKRKASSSLVADSTPVALKKLRLTGLSPALDKKKPKVGKSLFGNLSIN